MEEEEKGTTYRRAAGRLWAKTRGQLLLPSSSSNFFSPFFLRHSSRLVARARERDKDEGYLAQRALTTQQGGAICDASTK